MLVLSRKAGESLVIGDGITVTVQSVKGDVVRIAIDAPRQVPILRGELVAAGEVNREALGAEDSALQALRAGGRRRKHPGQKVTRYMRRLRHAHGHRRVVYI